MTWEDAWQDGRTGWDAGEAAPALCALIQEGFFPRGSRVLIPGCGSGYDALALAKAGCHVVGLDIAPTALERLVMLRDKEGLSADDVLPYEGSFFEYDPEEKFDFMWDYTFLCAIDLDMRTDWRTTVERVLKPSGQLVTLIFPTQTITTDRLGPPFKLAPEDVREILEGAFVSTRLEPLPQDLSHPKRGGLEWLGCWSRTA